MVVPLILASYDIQDSSSIFSPISSVDSSSYSLSSSSDSTDEGFWKKYEPFTATYDERIYSLKYLHDNGCKTLVSIEPYPTPNICEQDLEEVLEKIKFVDYIVFGRWHYSKVVSALKNINNFMTILL